GACCDWPRVSCDSANPLRKDDACLRQNRRRVSSTALPSRAGDRLVPGSSIFHHCARSTNPASNHVTFLQDAPESRAGGRIDWEKGRQKKQIRIFVRTRGRYQAWPNCIRGL